MRLNGFLSHGLLVLPQFGRQNEILLLFLELDTTRCFTCACLPWTLKKAASKEP